MTTVINKNDFCQDLPNINYHRFDAPPPERTVSQNDEEIKHAIVNPQVPLGTKS